jgi:hypothetical protein
MEAGMPVVSIEAKKKENVGNFKNNGREYSKTGEPVEALDHDFSIKELGKVTPYGIYDIFKNAGFVNIGSAEIQRYGDKGIALPAWDEQVEQNRTPALFVHK